MGLFQHHHEHRNYPPGLGLCITQSYARDVMCGKSTTVPINGLTYPVGPGEKFTMKTRKMTRGCVVSYKPANGCNAIRLRCPKFFVPNEDADKCRRGDFMRVKSDQDAIPEVYCQKNKPTTQYPAVTTSTMKIWYEADRPTFSYRNKGMTCEIYCEN